jgi:hypothetical protein
MSAPSVSVTARPLWLVRLGPRVARALVALVAVSGCAAAVRAVVAPPRPSIVRAVTVAPDDLSEQGFASLFARLYLTWTAADPTAHQQEMAPFAASGVDPDVGLTPPATGSETVLWTEAVQSRAGPLGERIYTVAAQTDATGLQYLAVPVTRRADGRLALGGYPAFVGAPASAPFEDVSASLPQLADPSLAVVVTRALRNYLSDAGSNLAADLTAAARVAVPRQPMALTDVVSLRWSSGDRSVLAQVQATDPRGTQYTLTYELAVLREQSRWEVSAIEIDPDS